MSSINRLELLLGPLIINSLLAVSLLTFSFISLFLYFFWECCSSSSEKPIVANRTRLLNRLLVWASSGFGGVIDELKRRMPPLVGVVAPLDLKGVVIGFTSARDRT
jgi:hypothetical protein